MPGQKAGPRTQLMHAHDEPNSCMLTTRASETIRAHLLQNSILDMP